MRTSFSIHVALPADRVFAFLANVANETQWRQSIVGSRYVNAESPALGVDGETDVSMGPRSLTMSWTIVEFVDGQHVAWRLDGNPWHGGGSYTVTATNAGSTINAALEVRLKGVARLAEPLIGFQLRRGLRTDLRRLETLLATVI